MARYERANWDPRGTTPGSGITPLIVIFHVTAGFGDAKPHDGLEWHFEVNLKGDVQQQVDTALAAAANRKANDFVIGGKRYGAISIETEGKGEGLWTPAQLDSLVDLSEWLMQVHPTIQRRICPGPFESGFGYHIMFGTPGPWTPVAKACPGPNRIKQFYDVLMPRILAGQPTPQEDYEMPIIVFAPGIASYLVAGGNLLHLTQADAESLIKQGIKAYQVSAEQIGKFRRDTFHNLDQIGIPQ